MTWVILIAYICLMIVIGFYCRRQTGNVSEYVLAGRSIGPWMTAFAYGTSYFSAVIFIGYAGQFGWSYGLSATWVGLGNAFIGSLMAWLLMGNRARKMTRHIDATTMPEYFEKRYRSKGLKLAAAWIIFLFLIPYTASVYNGLSTLFNVAFPGIPYNAWILIMGVFTAIYVILGGYKATAVNDFIQGIIMLLGISAVVVLAVKAQGGLGQVVQNLAALELNKDDSALAGNYASILGPQPLNLLGVVILTSLGTWGLPQMVQKFYAIKDKPAVTRGAVISTLFAVVVAGGSYFLGGLGHLFCQSTDSDAAGFIQTLSSGKLDYDSIVPSILQSSIPVFLFGIVVVLVLSASMSTLASLVLSSSSTMAIDMIQPSVKKRGKTLDEKKKVLIMRVLIAVFIIISVLIAAFKTQLNNLGINIPALMSISWGTLSGAFLAPFLYGLWSKKVTKAAVCTSFATGVGITVITMILFNLGYFPTLTQWASGVKICGLSFNLASPINWGAITMIIGLIEVPVISAFTKDKHPADVEEIFTALHAAE